MTTIKLGKEELVKAINSIVKEVHSTRADINRAEIDSSLDDLSDLDVELPGEHNEFDDLEGSIQQADDYEEDYGDDSDFYAAHPEAPPYEYDPFEDDYEFYAHNDRAERLGGHERFEESAPPGDKCEKIVKGLKKKFGKESSAPYAIAWDKHNKGICEEETLEEKIVRQLVRNMVKEQFSGLGGVGGIPSAAPTETNGNGVDGVVLKKKMKQESRVDPETPTGRAGGVQSQQAAKAAGGAIKKETSLSPSQVDKALEPGYKAHAIKMDPERAEAAKKRAAMKKAAGMQSLEETLGDDGEWDQDAYLKKVRELARIFANKKLPKEVRLAAKKAWDDLNASRPRPNIPPTPIRSVEPGDQWYGVDVYAGALNKKRGAS